SRYPMRSYPCDVPIVATPGAALPLLAEAVRRHADRQAVGRRRERIVAEHRKRQAAWDETALRQASAPTIGFAWASRCIGELVDESTVVVNEYPLDRRFAAFTRPGSYFGSPHSSGLGFGLGAALGVKLARPDATVIATVGDGAYFFGEPLSCLFVQRAHALPILTVIFNNQQWEARGGRGAARPCAGGLEPGQPPEGSLAGQARHRLLVDERVGRRESRDDPGAPRRSRGPPRHCSGGREPGQPPEESLAVQTRHRLLVDERVGRREARNDPEAMEHLRGGAHALRRRVHRAPHELGEVEVGGLEDLTVRLAAVLPDHLDAERPVGAESVDALGVRADVAQDDVGVTLRVAPGRRGAAVLERHVEPPEILDEIPATLRRLERLGRVHDDDVDLHGIEEPFELGPACPHRAERGVLREVPAPALERQRDRAVVGVAAAEHAPALAAQLLARREPGSRGDIRGGAAH